MQWKHDEVTFIHIPRTGGTSVCRGLGIAHSHDVWYRRPRTCFNFTVVRNPWDQTASWYRSARIGKTMGLSLTEWCIQGCPPVLEGSPNPAAWWEECHPFKQLKRAGPYLDAYFRFEDRELWWPTLSSAPMPHHHDSSDLPPIVWTLEAVGIVMAMQADTIKMFGYTAPSVPLATPGHVEESQE